MTGGAAHLLRAAQIRELVSVDELEQLLHDLWRDLFRHGYPPHPRDCAGG